MKKPLILSVMIALILLVGGFLIPSRAQAPAKDDTPTFYRLVPGLYVNGWPRFTIHYPKDWVEQLGRLSEVFRAKVPQPAPHPSLGVFVAAGSLDEITNNALMVFKSIAREVTVVGDKPSQLRDGTTAREVEVQMIMNGMPFYVLFLGVTRGDMVIQTHVRSLTGRIGEDLKAIPYSMEFQPDKDRPVQVPPDVEEFLKKSGNDLLSHDVTRVMANYSDRYLNSGMRKREVEQDLRRWISTVTSLTGATTEFVQTGDRAYLTGYTVFNFGTFPNPQNAIIKENGEWKWYGNQRDVVP
jgi:hypothetical protein